ncbi:MAG: type I secretion system permease/ATPase [Hyphomicrobiales bacterium]|nr:type I secretion system permease/ATPase [Hyphomicrobiales bacterium]
MTSKKPTVRSHIEIALAESRKIFILVGAFSLVINLLMLTGPLYMLQIYDRVLTSASLDTLVLLTALATGLIFAQSLLEFVRNRLLARLATRLDNRVSVQVMEAVVTHNLAKENRSAGHSLRDLDTLKGFLSGPGLVAFFDAPWTPLFMAAIFLIHPLLGVVALAGGLTLFILTAVGEIMTRRAYADASVHAQAGASFADASLSNAEAIEAMGMMPQVLRRWRAHHDATLAATAKAAERAAGLTAAAKFLRPILQIAMLGFGAWLVIRQEITPGVMIASSIIMGRALAPVEALISQWRNIVAARSVYGRLKELLQTGADVGEAMSLPRPRGRLSVENVIAAPPGHSKATVQNVSFALEPGETLGVIGPSGAGKSTLARLLTGAWRPVAGQVRLDGVNIAKWRSAERGPFVGYLPQGVELFEGTVAENIARLGEPVSEMVLKAAAEAGAHDMILRLSEGYETRIGPGGRTLSAGQRQRVALARALYGDPAFIVLDEPNANLDQEGEQALRRAILTVKARGATVILIAHHTSILGVCDKLLVLQNGRAEAFGGRDAVLAQLTRGPAETASDKGAARGIRAVDAP